MERLSKLATPARHSILIGSALGGRPTVALPVVDAARLFATRGASAPGRNGR